MKFRTKYFTLFLSPLFFAVITLLLTSSVDCTVIIALISSVLHECGHLALLLKYNCKIKSVTLSYYGMRIVRECDMKLSLKKEIAVCLAGVTVNFFLSVCFFIIYLILGRDILLKVSAVNLILGIFNLLPAFSFDGGRALEAFLECRYDIVKSEKILNLVSFSTLVPIMITGFIMFIKSGNFTLLMCCVYMLVSYIAK